MGIGPASASKMKFANRSSAIRLFVLGFYERQVALANCEPALNSANGSLPYQGPGPGKRGPGSGDLCHPTRPPVLVTTSVGVCNGGNA